MAASPPTQPSFGILKAQFLNAKQVTDTISPGVGTDGVFRDPWGNPYIVTLDLSYDNKCRDALYRLRNVSQQNNATGFNGLYTARTPTATEII